MNTLFATNGEADSPDSADISAKTFTKSPRIKDQYTVFLVEDDADDRDLMIRVLRESPHISKIHCFGSGDKLIGHIALEGYYGGGLVETKPTLILLDIHIPGASGLEILEELKDHPLTADIPVIIVTNDVSREKVAEALKHKANGYLTKPIQLEKVHEVLSKGWGSRKK